MRFDHFKSIIDEAKNLKPKEIHPAYIKLVVNNRIFEGFDWEMVYDKEGILMEIILSIEYET